MPFRTDDDPYYQPTAPLPPPIGSHPANTGGIQPQPITLPGEGGALPTAPPFAQAPPMAPPIASHPPQTPAPAPQQGGGGASIVFVRDTGTWGVNSMPLAAWRAAGTETVVFYDTDPALAQAVANARAAGLKVGIVSVGQQGQDANAYGANLAALSATYHPDIVVADVEDVGKGYAGSQGWLWSQQAATAFRAAAPGQAASVTMPPNQDDYNYGAYTQGGFQVWPQAYGANPATDQFDPNSVAARVAANGVDPNSIVVITAPGQAPPSGGGPHGLYAVDDTPGFSTAPGGGFGQTPGAGGTPGEDMPGPNAPPSGNTVPGPSQGPVTTPGAGPTGPPGADWVDVYFGSWGLPSDEIARLREIFARYDDPQTASQVALAYIRGTDWYAQHFAGIGVGIQKGLFSDEVGYRSYLNSVNVASQQYLGRDVTTGELVGYLGEGINPDTVGRRYAGDAYVNTYGGDMQFESGAFGGGQLSGQEMTAYGREQAGLDSPLGQIVQRRLQLAHQRLQTIFSGNLATGGLSLSSGGLSSPGLTGQKGEPDIGK